jgi:hypothetical protein
MVHNTVKLKLRIIIHLNKINPFLLLKDTDDFHRACFLNNDFNFPYGKTIPLLNCSALYLFDINSCSFAFHFRKLQ